MHAVMYNRVDIFHFSTAILWKKRVAKYNYCDFVNVFPDVTLTRFSSGYTNGCPHATGAFREVKPDCPSLDSPPASPSPLQQLLFEPTVHPVSFVAKQLTNTPYRVPAKRKHGNRRHVSYLIPREGFLTPRSTTLNHAVQCSGDQTSTNTHCVGLTAPKAEATKTEQFTSTPDKRAWCPVVRNDGIGDSVVDGDKYLLKVPRRCNADDVTGMVRECSATVALLDLSAQKRKSSEKLPELSPRKQRVSWPTTARSDVSHVVYRGVANKSFVTSVSRVPSTSAVSLCDGRRVGRSRSHPHSAPLSNTFVANYGSKTTRRPHISSWSADDVFAFVLSTPHASIYAKVSCPKLVWLSLFTITFNQMGQLQ